MAYLFDFNTVLGKILFVIVILAATHIHMLAGVLALLIIISINHNVIEGMDNKDGVSTDESSGDATVVTDGSENTDNNVSDVNGDDADTLISSFKTDNCKNGLLMKDDKEVTLDSIAKSFPSLKFLGETCNPCDDDCKFEIVSSAERLTAEENVAPVDSTTIPVDREALTKKQDE
jgi:hypothetical protein|tara:strand:+ start:1022 stop:1546 length:525 start_codon:yes stop_codon:yes gene_type:complete